MVIHGVFTRPWLALVAFTLMGCGEDSDSPPASAPKLHPVIGCETIDPAACDVRSAACQKKLLALAACMRGSDPGELPPVTHMTADEYAASLEADAGTAEAPADLPHLDATLALLGLAEPGALDPEASVMREASSVLAFYRDDSHDIVLIDQPDASAVDSSSTLLHELVHALQDRESDLTAYKQAHFDAPSDAFLAADAIVEGEARLHEDVYLLSLLGYDPQAIDLGGFFRNIVAADEPLFLDLPSPFLMAPYLFPYDWGARYVNLGWSGHQSMLALLAAPPQTTHAILASAARITDDAFTPSDIAEPAAPEAWEAVSDDVLGSFATFLMLQKLAGTEQARGLALAWRGDRLSVYAGSEASGDRTTTAFVWSCELDDDAHASDVADLLQQGLSDIAVRVSGTRVTVAAADDGSDVGWAW
jgi:hypothetical protein